MKKMLLILAGFAFAAQVELSVDGASVVNNQEAGTLSFDILMTSEVEVAGWQFDLLSDGVLSITSGSGGLTSEAGMMISASETTILAFSLTGGTIPAGTGVLFSMETSYDNSLSPQEVLINAEEEGVNGNRLIISGPGGTPITDIDFAAFYTESLESLSGIVQEYELSDNFPNPFNPSTNISFSVASYGEVSLVVFDALGREVNALVSEVYSPGSYKVTWNGDDQNGNLMSSGMYFYRLDAGEFSQTKKMLFMK